MKNIKDFILEVKDQWSGEKYIKKADLLKFCVKALKQSKTNPRDIQNEISQYEDPDDLDAAYERGDLTAYTKFDDALANLLADNKRYGGLEGDICDKVFMDLWDLIEELYKMTSK